VRVVEKGENIHPGSSHDHGKDAVQGNVQQRADGKAAGSIMRERFYARGNSQTMRWQRSCSCDTTDTEPQIVIDPFAGSGTVGIVAQRFGRRFVGIELNAEYLAMAQAGTEGPLFSGTPAKG